MLSSHLMYLEDYKCNLTLLVLIKWLLRYLWEAERVWIQLKYAFSEMAGWQCLAVHWQPHPDLLYLSRSPVGRKSRVKGQIKKGKHIMTADNLNRHWTAAVTVIVWGSTRWDAMFISYSVSLTPSTPILFISCSACREETHNPAQDTQDNRCKKFCFSNYFHLSTDFCHIDRRECAQYLKHLRFCKTIAGLCSTYPFFGLAFLFGGRVHSV